MSVHLVGDIKKMLRCKLFGCDINNAFAGERMSLWYCMRCGDSYWDFENDCGMRTCVTDPITPELRTQLDTLADMLVAAGYGVPDSSALLEAVLEAKARIKKRRYLTLFEGDHT